MGKLPAAHGGELRPRRIAPGAWLAEKLMLALSLPRVGISPREAADLALLSAGWLSPLPGFMGRADIEAVCARGTLTDGLPFPVPIRLTVDRIVADALPDGTELTLYDPLRDELIAIMQLSERFDTDVEAEALALYGTTDPAHPGVRQLRAQGEVTLAGPVDVLSLGDAGDAAAAEPGLLADVTGIREAFAEAAPLVAVLRQAPLSKADEIALRELAAQGGVLLLTVAGRDRHGELPSAVLRAALQVTVAALAQEPGLAPVRLAARPRSLRVPCPRSAALDALMLRNAGVAQLLLAPGEVPDAPPCGLPIAWREHPLAVSSHDPQAPVGATGDWRAEVLAALRPWFEEQQRIARLRGR